jgi:hypothetical protein
MSRRLPALVLAVVALTAISIVARTAPVPVTAVFTNVGADWMPAAPGSTGLTGSWFCPGVPATGEEGVDGEVVIANREAQPIIARVQWLSTFGEPVDEVVPVDAWSSVVLTASSRRQGAFVSAVVEIEGDGGIVEQRAIHPAGTAVSPCSNSTSAEWYLAEGFTVGGSLNQIVLTNPYEDVVIVDIGFATAEGSRTPAAYQGLPIAPLSVQVIDLGAPGAGAQGEERLAVRVVATRGKLVVGRSQHLLAGNRLGYTMSLAAPALRDQWWFADGDKGSGVTELFSIYNPTDGDVEVDVIFLGITDFAEVEPVLVPARQVAVVSSGAIPTLGEGRHATVFSTRSEPSIVVERTLTRVNDGRPSTSVVLGSPPRPDGYVATTWHIAAGPTEAADDALVVYNVDNSPGTLTIEAVGPDGPVPVAGLESIAIGPASVTTVDLVSEAVVGRQLIVTSTTRVFVERSLPSGLGAGRSASWALPAG